MQNVIQSYVECESNGAVTEPVNGNWLQAYCEYRGITEPSNSSWLQALCEDLGITSPLYGSWTIALANYYGVTAPLNGTWWYAIQEEACFGAVLPIADFTSDVTSITAGDTVNFTDTSTVPGGVPPITQWAWTFTGGTPATSSAQNPSVVYNTAGTYEVSLTVTNADGSNTKTVPNYITVAAAPQPVTANTFDIGNLGFQAKTNGVAQQTFKIGALGFQKQ